MKGEHDKKLEVNKRSHTFVWISGQISGIQFKSSQIFVVSLNALGRLHPLWIAHSATVAVVQCSNLRQFIHYYICITYNVLHNYTCVVFARLFGFNAYSISTSSVTFVLVLGSRIL